MRTLPSAIALEAARASKVEISPILPPVRVRIFVASTGSMRFEGRSSRRAGSKLASSVAAAGGSSDTETVGVPLVLLPTLAHPTFLRIKRGERRMLSGSHSYWPLFTSLSRHELKTNSAISSWMCFAIVTKATR
jgi:hypothetical protein